MQREDFRTSAWKHFMKDQAERLAELRELNDRKTLTIEETAAIRGQIAEVKRSLTLEKSSVGIDAQPGDSWPVQSAE